MPSSSLNASLECTALLYLHYALYNFEMSFDYPTLKVFFVIVWVRAIAAPLSLPRMEIELPAFLCQINSAAAQLLVPSCGELKRRMGVSEATNTD